MAEELADVLIRTLDTFAALGVAPGPVVAAKLAANAGRPFKHNKRY